MSVLILQPNNTTFNMNEVPIPRVQQEMVDSQVINYCVLDYSDPKDPDFFFLPLRWMEYFNAPCVELLIDEKYTIHIPLDWSLIIGDKEIGICEIVQLKHLNDRDFKCLALNPIRSFSPEFLIIEMVNLYAEIKWGLPKLKNGHLLAIPMQENRKELTNNEIGPLCAFFVKDINKLPDVIDIWNIFS